LALAFAQHGHRGLRLASDVVQRISAIDRRPTIGDHPAIEVPDAPEAGCDHAPVAIVIATLDAGRESGSSICIVNPMMFDAGVVSTL